MRLKQITLVLIFFFTFFIWVNPTFGIHHKAQFKYNLVICAIFRDEAPYLKEWIQFHRLLGVEHFYLYNNRSSDGFKEVLEPYINKKIVTLINWPYKYKEPGQWGSIQCSAYQDRIDRIKGKAKWLAILDIDEFLFPTEKESLTEFLKDYEQFGGLCVNWQMYGTSYVSKIPENKLLIETLHLKAPFNHEENKLVKSIVQPLKVISCAGPHICFFIPGFYQVNEHKEKFEGFHTPYISVDKIRVNHYWSRDEDFFYRVKIPRRESWKENIQKQINRLNALNSEQDDDAIQRFIPILRYQIFGKGL
jgi:Glycosyltransferase family 92